MKKFEMIESEGLNYSYGLAFKGLSTVAFHLALLELSRTHDTFFTEPLRQARQHDGDHRNWWGL